MISKRRLPPRKLRPVPTNCPFCQGKAKMSFLETEGLKNYISERGKIIGKDRSGICSKHQRQLSVEIKRARFLGLLPFTVQIK